ncbi:MAG TPA: MFS transporter [Pedobacter sp.]|jgi:MFS family permease
MKDISNTGKETNNKAVLFALCALCSIFCGFVSTIMSVYLPVTVKELLGNVSEQRLGEVSAYIGAMYLYGWMIGGFLFGFAGDKIGRVKAFVISVLIYSVFTILISFTHNWIMLVTFRFISGIGVGGTIVVSTILVAEVWPQKSRAIALGILAVTFPIGIISAGIVNNAFTDWRSAFTLAAVPLLAGLVSLSLKETDQWREMQSLGQDVKAKKNDVFHRENRRNLLTGSIIFGTMLIGLWAIFSWMPTWIQSLFSDANAGQKERGLSMILLGSGGIIGGALSGWFVNALGNRKTIMITFAGSFIMCFILFKTNTAFSSVIYMEIALLALFFGISQGALSAYLPSLFPTHIRSTATGFCFNIGRLATATVVFFVGALVTALGGYGSAVLTFSITFLIGLVVTFFSSDAEPHLN